MATTIRILGDPAIIHDGVEAPAPRGRKAWGLLAYLLLSERPATRRQLAELLFADAADPLGTLRWNLAQLRRALEGAAVIEGDPVKIVLAGDVEVDASGGSDGAGELLGGMEFGGSPAFESWLLVERGRYAGQAAAVLHEQTVSALGAGNADEAAELAARLVALDPFEENHHELLVRALAARGDRAGALAQVAACRRLFKQELGVEPSAAVRRAADVDGGAAAKGDRGAARAHLDAGKAALAAGAVEHGLNNLRQACAEAAGCSDAALHGRCLVALGSALVHSVRGRDEEGAVTLAEAVTVAEQAADRETLVSALRELAFSDLLAGRRASLEQRLERAHTLADNDDQRASLLAVDGVNRLDTGDYPGGLTALGKSVAHAEMAGERRRMAYALTFIARARILRGEHDEAANVLAHAMELVEAERWLAFLPFPEALLGELDLAVGDMANAAERFEHAFTLACQLGDPCWEGIAARNLALLHRERGESEASAEWMSEARSRCTRLPDRYVWMQGHVLDASIDLSLAEGRTDEARQLIRALGALAARTRMRELVVRGLVHASRVGEDGALESARMLAEQIDNPRLQDLLAPTS